MLVLTVRESRAACGCWRREGGFPVDAIDSEDMKYTFGQICVDAGARTLSNAAGPLHLTRKAFDLLVLLIERRPSAVAKEEIHARLWPDTFVSEASIQTLVHEIRQAIDEGSSGHSWIRTVHGIGYAFDGDVSLAGPAPPPSPVRPVAWLIGESIRLGLQPGAHILGRGMEDVVEIDLATISRRHARLTIGESATIEDLGSKNGTWVNDLRVTGARPLHDGDVVALGSAKFTFRFPRRPPSTESAELPPST